MKGVGERLVCEANSKLYLTKLRLLRTEKDSVYPTNYCRSTDGLSIKDFLLLSKLLHNGSEWDTNVLFCLTPYTSRN